MRARILIIDDDKDTAAVLKEYFIENGIPADIAFDGRSAEKKFDRTKHHLLIVDVNLPDIDGLVLAKNLKQKAGGVKILFLTGSVVRRSMLPSGRDYGFMEKPVPPGVLLNEVKAMLEVCE